jgi:hypothetical protein
MKGAVMNSKIRKTCARSLIAAVALCSVAAAAQIFFVQTPVVAPAGSSIVLRNGGGFQSGDTRFQLRIQLQSGGIQPNGPLRLFFGNQVLWTAPNTSPRFQSVPNATFVTEACILRFQSDGNLVVLGAQGVLEAPISGCDNPNITEQNMSVMWASNTSGNPGAILDVQNDGNVVIKTANNRVIWSTNTCCR